MVLFYWLALWMNWDVPKYGGLAIVIISLGTTGASIEKGLMRMVGTTVGVAVGFLILGLLITIAGTLCWHSRSISP